MEIKKQVEMIIGEKRKETAKRHVLNIDLSKAIAKVYGKQTAYVVGVAVPKKFGLTLECYSNTDNKGSEKIMNMMKIGYLKKSKDKKAKLEIDSEGKVQMSPDDFINELNDLLKRFIGKNVGYIIGWGEPDENGAEVSATSNISDKAVLGAWEDIRTALEKRIKDRK